MVDALVLCLFLSRTAVQVVNLWALSTVDVCPVTAFYFFQVCLAYLLSSHGLSSPAPESQLLGVICITYMHLTMFSLSFNPIEMTKKVIFSAHCLSPLISLFLHNAIGSLSSLREIQMTSLYISSHI